MMITLIYDQRGLHRGKGQVRIVIKTEYSEVMKLVGAEEIRAAVPYLIYGWENVEKRIRKIEECGWNPETMRIGLERLLEIAKGKYMYSVYETKECEKDPQKKDVNLIYFPASVDRGEKPFVVLCAGGGYKNVCSIAESYPLAAQLNKLGYPSFALTYRVGGNSLLPKPVDDLAAAIHFIRKNAGNFRVNPKRYLVIGFSAAGHLAALWGTDNHGYVKYNLPGPEAILPVYPLINSELFGTAEFIPEFRNIMFGKHYTIDLVKEYNIDEHINENYPASYIVCCKDDDLVPFSNSVRLKEKLDTLNIPVELELGLKGGHGFGDGRGTDVDGWIYRALNFCETIEKK